MAYQDLLGKVLELTDTVKLLGAIGAELQLRQSSDAGDPQIRTAIKDMVAPLGTEILEGLDASQRAVVIGQIAYNLQEALDFLREPARKPGWTYEDPAILQDRGRGSAAMANILVNLSRTRPMLASLLQGKRRMLDIGTGVAFLAIGVARMFPGMEVVGLDIWEPALALAKSNIAEADFQDRVTLRRQSVTDIEDEAAFDLVWMPSMFLPREVTEAALPRVRKAMRPGGMMIFGMYAPSGGPHGEAAARLLSLRSGGYLWSHEELTASFDRLGFAGSETVMLTGTTRGYLAWLS